MVALRGPDLALPLLRVCRPKHRIPLLFAAWCAAPGQNPAPWPPATAMVRYYADSGGGSGSSGGGSQRQEPDLLLFYARTGTTQGCRGPLCIRARWYQDPVLEAEGWRAEWDKVEAPWGQCDCGRFWLRWAGTATVEDAWRAMGSKDSRERKLDPEHAQMVEFMGNAGWKTTDLVGTDSHWQLFDNHLVGRWRFAQRSKDLAAKQGITVAGGGGASRVSRTSGGGGCSGGKPVATSTGCEKLTAAICDKLELRGLPREMRMQKLRPCFEKGELDLQNKDGLISRVRNSKIQSALWVDDVVKAIREL